MKKINRNYISFSEYYFGYHPPEDAPPGYGVIRFFDGSEENPVNDIVHGNREYHYPKYQLLGSLRPLAKMGKDFLETFRPYSSTGKIVRDAKQPLSGLKNIGKGLFSIMGGAAALALCAFYLFIIFPTPLAAVVWKNPIVQFIYPLSWLSEGVLNVVRGVTQVVTSPLTYLFKMPLRGLLTLWKKPAYAENKSEITRLANEARVNIKNINDVSDVPTTNTHTRAYTDLNGNPISEESRFNEVVYCVHDIPTPQYQLATDNNERCARARMQLAGQLYEINRKYNKSVADGWKTNLQSTSVTEKYNGASSFFSQIPKNWDKWKNAPSPETAGCRMWQRHQPISNEDIKATVDYLDLISPVNSNRA